MFLIIGTTSAIQSPQSPEAKIERIPPVFDTKRCVLLTFCSKSRTNLLLMSDCFFSTCLFFRCAERAPSLFQELSFQDEMGEGDDMTGMFLSRLHLLQTHFILPRRKKKGTVTD